MVPDAQPPIDRSLLRLALLSAILVGCAGMLGAAVLHLQHGYSTLWPSSPVIATLLLDRGRGWRAALTILLSAWLGLLGVNGALGLPALQSVVFPLVTLAEATAFALILRAAGHPGSFARVLDVGVMLVASATVPLLSATMAAAVLAAQGQGWLASWAYWYRASALSLALITPSILIAMQGLRGLRGRSLRWGRLARGMLAVGLVAATAALVFAGFARLPLYTMIPVALIATFRFRQIGAAAAMLVIALAAVLAVQHDIGPIARATADPVGQAWSLQLFLAVVVLTLLPVSAVLAERDARAAEARMLAAQLRAVVDNVGDVIFRIDDQGRWTYLNPAWEGLTGLTNAASIGAPWLALIEDAADPVGMWAEPVLHGTVPSARNVVPLRVADGDLRWVEISMDRLLDARGLAVGATGVLRDVTDRKRLEDHVLSAKRRAEDRAREAVALAATDDLTGLCNRRALLGQLDKDVTAALAGGQALTVAVLDVDHFKEVNDRFGHAVGDRVLQGVAARAQAVVRGNDLVGRIGGEEFAVIMPGARLADAMEVAERLRHAIQRGVSGEDVPAVTVSIGLAALAPGDDAPSLLAAADRALYDAKDAGRNRVRLAA